MTRKYGLVFLLLLAAAVWAQAQQTAGNVIVPDPYDADEFPLWARDLRRAEIVAFGSLPFTVFFSTLAMDSLRYAQHEWDRRYAPWPLKGAGAIEMDESQRIAVFAAGVGAALFVSALDHAIVRLRRHREREAELTAPKGDIRIERRPIP